MPNIAWISDGKNRISTDGRFKIEPSSSNGQKFKKGTPVYLLTDTRHNRDTLLKFPKYREFMKLEDAKIEANMRLEELVDS